MTAVSVVMSTYNRNLLLFNRSLPSVLRQTFRDFDVHIVSDGMRGDELDELERGIAAFPQGKINLWKVPRQSYPADPTLRWYVLGLNARNTALDYAGGDWIAPLDDDDEWTPTHLDDLLLAAQAAEADFAYGISQYHWPDDHPQTAGHWPPGFGAFCDGAQVYRNGMGYRYDPMCIERGIPEDGDLWNRMVAGGVKFTFLPKLVHHYYPSQR